jgi:hypothetical protein
LAIAVGGLLFPIAETQNLLLNGVPPAAEAVMVGAMHGNGDSPPQAAKKAKSQQSKLS